MTVGTNIVLFDAAGGNERPLFQQRRPGTTVLGMEWAADGRSLYAGLLESADLPGQPGSRMRIERIDLGTRATSVVISAAAYPAVAPDGSSIAFISYSGGPRPPGLWLAKPDGSDARLLVAVPAVLAGVRVPRFSPDSRTLAFGAVDAASENETAPTCPRGGYRIHPQPDAPSNAWTIVRNQAERLWGRLTPAAAAHGPPVDMWAVAVSGGAPYRLSAVREDDPAPAWSPDGARLAVIGSCALSVIPSTGGASAQLGPGAVQSQVDWR